MKFEVEEDGGRFRTYTCSQAHYKFKVSILANVFPDEPYRKHAIEDHLLDSK
ncbi:MAG: hypothetical protein ACXQTS_02945 [Candidatus Methanospirareceae archaeon]